MEMERDLQSWQLSKGSFLHRVKRIEQVESNSGKHCSIFLLKKCRANDVFQSGVLMVKIEP
jgi:hypothetical protein